MLKQIRVVDLIILAGIALLLGAQDVGRVPLGRTAWFTIAGLLAVAGVAIAIAHASIRLQSWPSDQGTRTEQT